jgi:hypothetical protein
MASRAQALIARAKSAQLIEEVDDFIDSDTQETKSTARVSRSGYGTLPVYKLTPSGVVRIKVAVQSISEVLSHPAYSAVCQDCGNDDCCAGAGDTVNDCPGRPARQFRTCPIVTCGKRIYDSQPTGQYLRDEFDHSDKPKSGTDSAEIRDDTYASSTPESRTRTMLDMHLIGYHPQEAADFGVNKPRELPRMAIVS